MDGRGIASIMTSVNMFAKLIHRQYSSMSMHVAPGRLGSHLPASGRQDVKDVTTPAKALAVMIEAIV